MSSAARRPGWRCPGRWSRRTGWAAGYNIVAIPLAAGVLAAAGFTLTPAIGAVLMSASTIVVALNAQLLRRLDLRPEAEAAEVAHAAPERAAAAA